MKKFLLCLFATVIIAGSAVVCSAAPELKASSAIMASLTSDQIIYSKNPDSKAAPAELTRLMTAYTTYKLYGMDTVITVPEGVSDFDLGYTRMKLQAGEEIKSGDLIYSILMYQEEANDSVYAVALTYGGVDKFTAKMNEYAKALDMKNTSFANPTGKDDSNQYTTADDMLKLYKAFYKDKTLYKTISTNKVVLPATNLSGEREIWSKNSLICTFHYVDYLYEYATAGIKSSTDYGGYSVVASAVKGDKEFVSIVLNSVAEEGVNCAMTDAQGLFNYGFDELETVDVVKNGGLLYETKLKNGKGTDTLLLCANKTIKAEISKNDDVSAVQKQVVINEPVEAPIKKGDVLGKVIYTYQGNIVGEAQLIAEEDVGRSALKAVFSGIGWFFGLSFVKFILAVVVIGFALLVFAAYLRAKQRKKRRRNRRTNYTKF